MQRRHSQEYSSNRTRPATSYVAATFHPTIGQCAHQSLSNTATPELGMITQGLREQVGLHIAKGHKSASQHSWFYQAINISAKPAQSKGKPLHTSSKRIPSQPCGEGVGNRVTVPSNR